MAERSKLPTQVEAAVLTKSRRRCALCFGLSRDFGEKKGQIAHLDQNPDNNDENNLSFLCFDHHDAYDSQTRQSKNYKPREVRAYRDELYRFVAGLVTDPTAPVEDMLWCVVDDPEERFADVATLARARRPSDFSGTAPYREIICRPELRDHPAIPLSKLAIRTASATVNRSSGASMFPMLDTNRTSARDNQAATYVDGAAGRKLSTATDGSIHYVEFADEAFRRPHPIWGLALGLFHCLDRLVGAAMFSEHLLQPSSPTRTWLILKVGSVAGAPFIFDYNEPTRAAMENRYAIQGSTLYVGGWILLPLARDSLAAFAAECGAQLSFLAGRDVSDDSHAAILNEVRTTIVDATDFRFERDSTHGV